jgi:K+ transporter
MKLRTLMIIKAIVCLGFGPLLLFVPEQLLNILGADYSSGAALTAREYGAVLIGTVLLTWYARNSQKSSARKAIIIHLFVYDAIAFIATVILILNGSLNALGWGIAFVYIFFTVGYGYFLMQEKE